MDNKLKTNTQIVYELIRYPDKYNFWNIISGFDSLHISYQHQHEKNIIKQFESLTDRNYTLGCIMPTKDTLGKGLIVLLDGFR